MGSLLDFALVDTYPSALMLADSASNIPACATTSPRTATTSLEKHIDLAKLTQSLFRDGS